MVDKIVDWVSNSPALAQIGLAFGNIGSTIQALFGAFKSGKGATDIMTILQQGLGGIVSPEVIDTLGKVVEFVMQLVGAFQQGAADGGGFAGGVSGVIDKLREMSPVIDTVVGAISKVWTFLSTVVIPFLQNTVFPWIATNLPKALQTLSDFWTKTLQPAITTVWAWLSGTLIPFLQNTVFPWLATNIPNALQTLSNFWTNTLQPAITTVWAWISGTLIPFFENTVVPWLQEKIPQALQTLSDFWNKTLLPAITDVWNFINTYLVPIFNTIFGIVSDLANIAIKALTGAWDLLYPKLQDAYNFLNDHLTPAFTWLKRQCN